MADSDFILLGVVWLDFVNTARGHTPSPPDRLCDEAAVERWAAVHSLEPANGHRLSLEVVRRFRDSLAEMAEALHLGLQPPAGSITAINEHLARNDGIHQLTRVGGTWQLRFAPVRRPAMLEAIAQSAASCLADPVLLVRRCAGETCSLFFTDDSPNQGRRWCNPAVCGGQLKIERRRGLLR